MVLETPYRIEAFPVSEAREAVLDLHRRTYFNFDERFTGPLLDRMTDGVAGMLDEAEALGPEACRVWLALGRQGPAGSAAWLKRDERAQLRWVAVLPEARGYGLGRQLVEAVVEHARKSGSQDIYLKTVDRLEMSMALYHSIGFVTVREETAPLWYGAGHEIEMVLPLDP
ncbi:GNAT family N-acetyltransferase [Henriciella aquimarina]|uniref:GNAT family N-acetyltransferase n=1 Tax=Henriciella aquimarina TaxID=545261 RepID=UPI0009FFCD26|nr:GNAT family N-acetyltransferase [Henriciella aquimarina]